MSVLHGAPLCPALFATTWHLPHLGGDWPSVRPSPIANIARINGAPELPTSPLVGEMSGRTEGGPKELHISPCHQQGTAS
ncbi:MAG: hypothetical protein EOR81_21620 [Mesorhizobium sp.]|nr:MAG: hypothetical protein EOR81_21620 [Mesorhizobium sp.]